MVPHVVLVAVLIGYLCLGASILQALETRTELIARSRKLVRLGQLIDNFTAESWHILDQAGIRDMHQEKWAAIFRSKIAIEIHEI